MEDRTRRFQSLCRRIRLQSNRVALRRSRCVPSSPSFGFCADWAPQLSRGRDPMMSGDVYRNAQIIALQKGTLGLKPGQILLRDSATNPETPYAYPHPHSSQLQPQPSRHHDHHIRHAYPQPGAPMHDPRTLLERPMPTQMGPSAPQRGSPGNYSDMDAVPPIDPTHTRRRTPSPTAATTHSDEDDDAGLAIGMALMGGNQNHSHASTDTTTTVVASDSDSSPRHSVQKILLREPTDEPSPPYTAHDNHNASPSRTHVLHDYRPQGPAVMQNNYRGEVWETPPITMPRPGPIPPQEPIPQFVPVPAPIPTPSQSRHASWHPQPAQSPPQQYSRPSRQDIYSFQPQPSQQRVVPANPGLSRSSTYAPGSLNPYADRSALATSLKAGGGTPPSSSTPSLRGRETDTRSVQQSVMTMSNASSRSQGGENPRRNRFLPKRLIMPAPLQPALQNQATIHQVRFDPQANSVYAPRDPSPPKIKHSSLAPPPRAQDIHMAPSNGKLRKRMSLVGGMKSSKEPSAPPVAAVSFSANIVSADRHARGAERVQKKVLSKRK
ncbi:hypothetical protein P691DRAFT_65727 [Macrolepiota fuliginosa MF-IS2]|uniref:Uncharacterized protein n=1 Tax=Macrolepiota fuliginosa MF-IS2 TaxID=1400762 RepID=A0A9P6C185_9AGAR|nr:hypothetical protein P691DRAFT_65727 [Macrolepiota fuliginosa MF-IS2]